MVPLVEDSAIRATTLVPNATDPAAGSTSRITYSLVSDPITWRRKQSMFFKTAGVLNSAPPAAVRDINVNAPHQPKIL